MVVVLNKNAGKSSWLNLQAKMEFGYRSVELLGPES